MNYILQQPIVANGDTVVVVEYSATDMTLYQYQLSDMRSTIVGVIYDVIEYE